MGDHLATMGRKVGADVPLLRGKLGPDLTQCPLGPGLYVRTKWHIDPPSRLATTDMGRKLWRGAVPIFEARGAGCPHLAQMARAETYLRANTGILIHPTV